MTPRLVYEVGDRIIYLAFGGDRRIVTVLDRLDDVKNGEPGFDAVMLNGGHVWGYDRQIVATPTQPDGVR